MTNQTDNKAATVAFFDVFETQTDAIEDVARASVGGVCVVMQDVAWSDVSGAPVWLVRSRRDDLANGRIVTIYVVVSAEFRDDDDDEPTLYTVGHTRNLTSAQDMHTRVLKGEL